MKILAIGNSFSDDATYYLHQIAEADGEDAKVVNLYIGGCSLEQHWNNIVSEEEAYLYQLNGCSTEKYVSIPQALEEEAWDYVITQQASHDSGWENTYEPFLGQLLGYIREKVPGAKILLQKTWAYEIDSDHGAFARYHKNQQEMYDRLTFAYEKASKKEQVALIPSADVIQKLRTLPTFDYANGGMSICRDGFHMHYIYGRYALAATWYATLFHKKVSGNSYIPATELAAGETVDVEKLNLIQAAVDEIA